MATATLKWLLEVTLGDETLTLTNPASAPTVTVTQKLDQVTSVAASTAVTLWDPTLATVPTSLTDFDFLYLLSTQDGFLELTCNEDDAAERVFPVPVGANIPVFLGRDDGLYNFTQNGDSFAGVADVIDRLRFKNMSATTAATVRLVLLT